MLQKVENSTPTAQACKCGKTPVLSATEWGSSCARSTADLKGVRDRAVISLMAYAFARVCAAIALEVEDYYVQGRRGWIRLHEKGGKVNQIPCHHNLETSLGRGWPRRAPPRTRPHRCFRASGTAC